MIRKLLFLACTCLALAASSGAQAHRFHTGITELSHNDQTGSVEIVHTLMAHDIDALMAARHKRTVDLSDEEDEQLLRKYVEERFYLLGKGKQKLPLKWVGVSASVESVVVYQELEKTALTKVERIHNDLLVDFLPRQANTLNIKQDGKIRSLAFDRKNPERAFK
jgi:hypothetical protein